MSCILTSIETLNIIAQELFDEFSEQEYIEDFILELLRMNVQAFEARYEGRHAENLDLYADEYFAFCAQDHLGKPEISAIQKIKSFSFYLYQCNESTEISNSELYLAVEAKYQELLANYVQQLPEWKAAAWR